MNPSNAEQKLFDLVNYEKGFAKYHSANYTPGKAGRLLEKKGIPLTHASIIHIAGTKGKGSTAHYLSVMMEESGIKTGLFTSPHLLSVHERIQIDHVPIPEQDLHSLIDEFMQDIQQDALTYFDALTFLGMVYFIRNDCEAIILETGLGGRLDSTNFVTPELSMITPISKDHSKLLGSTLSAIAGEKAGIIKPGVPVLIAPQAPEVLKVLQETAESIGSDWHTLEEHTGFHIQERTPSGIKFHCHIEWARVNISFYSIQLAQTGDIFVQNFVHALMAAFMLEVDLNPQLIRNAASFQIPYRMQKIGHTLFDVSHNGDSLEHLFNTLKLNYAEEQKNLFISVMKDKELQDIADIIKKYANQFNKITIFDFEHARPSGGKDLFSLMEELPNIEYVDDITILKPDHTKLNVLTGSFYSIAPYQELYIKS